MHRHVLSSPDCRFKCSVDCLKILDSVEILFLNLKYRVCTQSWILEKVLKFAENFPDPEKVWKIEVKSWKNSKKSRFFFKLQQVLNKWNVFCAGQMLLNLACHCGKSFVPAFFFFIILRSLLITYLITLSLENDISEKVWRKVLNFGSKICMNPLSKSRI